VAVVAEGVVQPAEKLDRVVLAVRQLRRSAVTSVAFQDCPGGTLGKIFEMLELKPRLVTGQLGSQVVL